MTQAANPVPTPLGNVAVPSGTESTAGLLIVNADDWGRDQETTQRTFECIGHGSISSVSAMVFMADSARAAAIARERGIDAGLHLNLTTPFSAPGCPARLLECHGELAKCLLRHRLSQVLFYPTLMQSFKYVVSVQLDEFCRLYGAPPWRIDGHHHMHLCANVLLERLLPSGTIVRRNFSFQGEEKGFANRLYRQAVDRMLARRHGLTDFFFSLMPLQPERIQRIVSLAHRYVVEVETHPANSDEYRFLAGGEIHRLTGSVAIAPRFAL